MTNPYPLAVDPIGPAGSFLITFLAMFLAEVGDKSQVGLLLLRQRHSEGEVMLGGLLGFAVVSMVVLAAGALIGGLLPERPVRLIAVIVFGFSALYSWARAFLHAAPRQEDGQDLHHPERNHPGWAVACLMVAVLEIGDKSQLALLGLAAGLGQPVAVFFGGIVGFAFSSGLALMTGGAVQERLGTTGLHVASGTSFAIVALALLALM